MSESTTRPARRFGLPARVAIAGLAGIVVVGIFTVVVLFNVNRDPHGAAALTGQIPARPAKGTANGVFTGGEVAPTEAYQKWFGAPVALAVAFSVRDTWPQIADPREVLTEWKGSGFRLVYSVALLPEQDPSANFATAAAGGYDRYYRQLAQNLVAEGQRNAILRLGWEFNLGSWRWSTSDPQAFISYWRHVVAAMRSVPGQQFQFDWNPNNGRATYDAVLYYPGDDVVDYVGVDSYDDSWAWGAYPYPASCDDSCRAERQTAAWNKSIYGGRRGLKFWSQFARHRGKPMSLPEWGLWSRPDGHGGGNDPAYLKRMHDFIADPANDVAYQCYFEFDGPDGPHRLMTTFASSGDTFRALFARP